MVPRQWKVIQTVREKFTCRRCETITQPPAPFHADRRAARAGAEPAGDDPVRQVRRAPAAEPAERELRPRGHRLDVSTLADWVGACAAALAPLVELIRRHVLRRRATPRRRHDRAGAGQEQDHDRPVVDLCPRRSAVRRAGPAGGAVLLLARPQRRAPATGISPAMPGSCRPTPMPGSASSTTPSASPAPITEAACWSHGRRKFFELADLRQRRRWRSRRCAASTRSSRSSARSTALAAEQRLAVRQDRIAPLVAELEDWMRAERARLSRHAEIAKAIDYMLKRWPAFTRFLDDGRICLTNNAAERALRGIALGRRAWLFAGSDRGGERAAAMYTLIGTAKLNDIDPQAWLADVLAPHRRSSGLPPARAAALELEARRNPSRRRLTDPHRGLRRMLTNDPNAKLLHPRKIAL